MAPAVFEHTILAGELTQIYALDREVTETSGYINQISKVDPAL